MIRSRTIASALAIVVLSGAPSPAQDPAGGPPVLDVAVRGNERVSTEYILGQIETAAGKPYDPKTVDEDIRRLARLNLFAHIEVEQRRVPEGYRIAFVVTENVLITGVEFRGVVEGDVEEIRKVVKVRALQPLVLYLLHLDRDEIRRWYLEKGFLFAEVSSEVVAETTGNRVIFRIEEGPEVEVDDLRFVGNDTFDDGDLEDLMVTEESWLLSTTTYRAETLQEDLIALKAFYRSKGFFDVEVDLQDVKISEDLEEIDLVIFVEEGPRYEVERIEIEGARLVEPRELSDRFKQKESAYFDQADILADRDRIESLYGQNAHLDAKVDVDFFYAPEGHKVTLVYSIVENGPSRVGRVDIRGNVYTRDDVVRRLVKDLPSQWANSVRTQESLQALQGTGWFSSAKVKIEPGRKAGEKTILYEVEEGQTGAIRLAAGVTSNIGVIGDVSLRKDNFDIADLPESWDDFLSGGAFTGGGQSLVLQFQPGTEILRFHAGFEEPYLFGYPYSLGLDFQHLTRKRESYDETRFGGSTTLGHPFREDLRGQLTYRNEIVEIEDVDDDAPSLVRRAEGRTNIASLSPALELDRRNDPIVPSKGYRTRVAGELASDAFGGEENFYKIDLAAEWFTTVYETEAGHPHVIGLTGRFGFGDELAGSDEIPIFERYFAGGFGSLRGFEFRGVGPMESGDPIGGEAMALAGVEYSLPLYKDILRGVLFVDTGTVARELDGPDFGRFRVATGFGFRVRIPFLGQKPFAIDFGFPILKEDDDEEEIVSFSLGRSF